MEGYKGYRLRPQHEISGEKIFFEEGCGIGFLYQKPILQLSFKAFAKNIMTTKFRKAIREHIKNKLTCCFEEGSDDGVATSICTQVITSSLLLDAPCILANVCRLFTT